METVTYSLRVETGIGMVSMMMSRETVTYSLRVETGSDMVSMMVGSRWRLSHTS
jgi:hypothetical protein